MAAGRKGVRPLALGFIAAAIVARAVGFSHWLLLTQCDGLAMGGLLAVLLGPGERRARFPAAFAGLCLLAAAFTVAGAPMMSRLGGAWTPAAASLKIGATNAFYLGFIGLLVVFSGHWALAILRDRRLCYLGQISYGLYLYHYILIVTAEQLLPHYGLARTWWIDLALLSSCLILAALSWRFIERPILSLKDRVGYQPGPVAPTPGELSPAWGR